MDKDQEQDANMFLMVILMLQKLILQLSFNNLVAQNLLFSLLLTNQQLLEDGWQRMTLREPKFQKMLLKQLKRIVLITQRKELRYAKF